MDTFKEYIVKKELTQSEKISRICIIVASIALAFFFIAITLGTVLMMFGIIFAGLSVYFGWQIITRFFVEYEYIVTNSDLDIDKITNQSKRKRLCTVDLHKVSECGKYSGNVTVSEDETLIQASANNPELDDYYLRFTHKTFGNAVLVFTPSIEVLELIQQFFPRTVKKLI
ncbi:MAG: DUF6106 family protein [Ruminococcus sp.]|nr:DUF6106 family protein [Ruminococcus sp.]